LVSSVGGDFDPDLLTLLESYFDLAGLQTQTNILTPRAWQVFDANGTRHETFQTDFEEMKNCIPKPDQLPDAYAEVSGVYLQCPPEEVDLWVPALRQRGCKFVLWEPWDMFCVPENLESFIQNCQLVDIVSPNLREARMLTGLDDPEKIILELKNFGAPTVALRMAEAGSLVVDAFGDLYPIPAYPAEHILDVTGAGNAYCGGFLYGFARTGDALQAGWYGGVSGSLALHQFGALYSLDKLSERAQSRLDWYKNQA
jgi:sugar/nucleoside kinase (ribokinase family)